MHFVFGFFFGGFFYFFLHALFILYLKVNNHAIVKQRLYFISGLYPSYKNS